MKLPSITIKISSTPMNIPENTTRGSDVFFATASDAITMFPKIREIAMVLNEYMMLAKLKRIPTHEIRVKGKIKNQT